MGLPLPLSHVLKPKMKLFSMAYLLNSENEATTIKNYNSANKSVVILISVSVIIRRLQVCLLSENREQRERKKNRMGRQYLWSLYEKAICDTRHLQTIRKGNRFGRNIASSSFLRSALAGILQHHPMRKA